MLAWLRVWWRGYADGDLASARAKLATANRAPGGLTYLTRREMRALISEHPVE